MQKIFLGVVFILGIVATTFGQSVSETFNYKYSSGKFIEMKNTANFTYNEVDKTVQITYSSGKTYWKTPLAITNVIKMNDNIKAFEYKEEGLSYYIILKTKDGKLYAPIVIDGYVSDNFKLIKI